MSIFRLEESLTKNFSSIKKKHGKRVLLDPIENTSSIVMEEQDSSKKEEIAKNKRDENINGNQEGTEADDLKELEAQTLKVLKAQASGLIGINIDKQFLDLKSCPGYDLEDIEALLYLEIVQQPSACKVSIG